MKKIMCFLLCSMLVFSFAGCGEKEKANNDTPSAKKVATSEGDKNTKTNEEVTDKEVSAKKVTLYFVDDQAMYLNKEEIELDKVTAEALIDKLKEGPKESNHYPAVPKDVNIKVKVEGNTAYLDLEKDIDKKIEGSTGESMFVYSIVNTLTLNKDLGIEQVKFLKDGKDTDTINGHMDTSEPFKANNSLIK